MKKIELFQVSAERDKRLAKFLGLTAHQRLCGEKVEPYIYDRVFEKDISNTDMEYMPDKDLCEVVFRMLNDDARPAEFLGHSMSVSDVLLIFKNSTEYAAYYCDNIGFARIDFDRDKAGFVGAQREDFIRVVILEQDKSARTAYMRNADEAIHHVLGGPADGEYLIPGAQAKLLYCKDLPQTEHLPARTIHEFGKRDVSYGEMCSIFRAHERKYAAGEVDYHLTGYVVISEDSFTEPYSLEARTYVIGSGEKAFRPNMGGYSIFASSLDGSDCGVRIENCLRAERGGELGWNIEACYMWGPGEKVFDTFAGNALIVGISKNGEHTSLTPEQCRKLAADNICI